MRLNTACIGQRHSTAKTIRYCRTRGSRNRLVCRSHQKSQKRLSIGPMVALDKLALQTSTPVLNSELLIGYIGFTVKSDPLNLQSFAIRKKKDPRTSDLDPVAHRTILSECAHDGSRRDNKVPVLEHVVRHFADHWRIDM